MKLHMELAGHRLIVDYSADPGEPSITSGHPDNWYAGSNPEVEVISCVDEDSGENMMNLYYDNQEAIDQVCLEDL
jgi:hypothetical protein